MAQNVWEADKMWRMQDENQGGAKTMEMLIYTKI
jgi:hypothetical protein